jgi:hypothetical protein
MLLLTNLSLQQGISESDNYLHQMAEILTRPQSYWTCLKLDEELDSGTLLAN